MNLLSTTTFVWLDSPLMVGVRLNYRFCPVAALGDELINKYTADELKTCHPLGILKSLRC